MPNRAFEPHFPPRRRRALSNALPSDSALEAAAKRLERAVLGLEQRLNHRLGEARAEAGGLFDLDRNRLAAELDHARAREKALEAAGSEASEALARAMAEIRAALADEEGKSA